MTSNKTSASLETNASAMLLDNGPAAIAAQPFRLLDLPDELWSRIGKMVINDLPAHRLEKTYIRSGHSSTPKPPPILQVCSALRNELRLEYFRTKVDILLQPRQYIADLDLHMGSIGRYLRIIGPDARRQLKLSYDGGVWLASRPLPPPDRGAFEEWWGMKLSIEARRISALHGVVSLVPSSSSSGY
ncbi:hypothetical protein TI39_contig268g00001 [Zymoseptoria brevis]|uniref:F-box domain-containing protein n=1 Tax=Zymoseptoria brevis TaxID=1047168 RepID=A0A0F4GX48_9PEZI|nr:hypothetical protein TI39_contig268g00001 [Zymoseptoria brevis]